MKKSLWYLGIGIFVLALGVGYGCSDSAAAKLTPDPSLSCGGSSCVK